VASGIVLSRVSGLARERAFGYFLGTTFAADAFTAAFRIPGMIQRLAGEGALSASFIPVYSQLLAEGRNREARKVAGAVLGLLAAATSVVVLAGVVLAEPLTWVVAAGFHGRPRTFALTVALVRILFPAAGLLALSSWSLGILNSHRRFFVPYVAPVLFNLAQIGVLLGVGLTEFADVSTRSAATQVDARSSLATWLAVGAVAGGLLQFVVQLPAVLRVNRGVRPSLRADLPAVRATIRAFWPVVAARGGGQLLAFVQTLLASFLAAGALAMLRYAQILYLLPVAVFGIAISAAELPELARAGSRRRTELLERLQHGLARVAAFVVPTATAYLVIGDLVTSALFQTGQFGRADAIAVSAVLAGYALGLLASTSSRLLRTALYGLGNTRTPARIAAARIVVALALGAALMWQLDRVQVTASGFHLTGGLPAFGPLPAAVRTAAGAHGATRLGAAGLSLATGLASWLEFGLLRRAVRLHIGRTRIAGGQLRPILAAAAAAGLTAYCMQWAVAGLPPVAAGVAAVTATGTIYGIAATMFGVTEIRHLVQALSRRLPRRPTAARHRRY
jgi:putative peptidoglycan lipid II flippase